jgi:hypothetical protein
LSFTNTKENVRLLHIKPTRSTAHHCPIQHTPTDLSYLLVRVPPVGALGPCLRVLPARHTQQQHQGHAEEPQERGGDHEGGDWQVGVNVPHCVVERFVRLNYSMTIQC